MTQLEVSDQRSHVQLGPGLRWGEVYNALEPYDLTVAGGRVALVGVPGLLLAGGIGFYSNQDGLSASTISSYEVVLTDGRIMNLTAFNEYSDLFWAAIPSPRVFAGVLQFESSQLEAFFEAVAAYSADIFDAKSHIVLTIEFARDDGPDEISSYAYVVLFYDDPDETESRILSRFLDIPNVGNTLSHQTVANLTFEAGMSVMDGQSDILTGGTIATRDFGGLLAGIQLVSEIFEQAPLGRDFIVASQKDGAGVGPLALDESQGIYVVYAIALTWVDSQYDEVISAWIEEIVKAIDSATAEAGLHRPFRHMGDSAAFQVAHFFNGYPQGVVERPNSVALKYDPDGLFQKNMPGGFKLSVSKTSSNDDARGVDGRELYDAGIFKQGGGSVSGFDGFDPLQR
ncbi:Bifunctional solanapyrone synthase [Colletotrichum sp. SAR11_240]|nr:Bifunctional solanapyrone synthase [Colletotrichum sp. SAR11_240]